MLRAAVFVISILLVPAIAQAQSSSQSSRYGSWQGGEQSLKTFATELGALVDEAERGRAANPLSAANSAWGGKG